ncbi:MAG: CpaF family protein, partial [Lachnospiraceae bacterium]|nr:CpaF family protein [Lachnospiraceae bacterium]
MDERKLELRARILEKIDLSKDLSDEEILLLIREEIVRLGQDVPLPISERKRLERELYNSLRKLDILEDLLSDESITEIMINGTDNIFIEKNGSLQKSGFSFENRQKLEDVVQQIVSSCNRVVNEASPT